MSAHDWAPGELDAEAAAREERYANAELEWWEREQLADRLGRDMPGVGWCAVCGEHPGKSIYGMKCAGCFQAQREERDAA